MKATTWILLALSTAGCDPIMGLNAHVAAAPTTVAGAGLPSFETLAPVPNASLSLTCPANRQYRTGAEPLARSDADGRVHWSTIGLWPHDCSIVVKADGYYDESFPLSGLCPPGVRDCHFVAVQAELASKSAEGPPPSVPPAAAPVSSTQVHFSADRTDLTVLRFVRENGRLRAWEPVCRPPCDAPVSAIDRLAVARGDGPPVEPQPTTGPTPESPLAVRYENRTTARRVIGVGALTGMVGAFVMVAVGIPGDNQPWQTENVALTGGAFALLAGSVLTLLLTTQMVDTVQLTRE